MSQDSNIEWTDDTVNPWWGCTKVSPACANCYAEGLDNRFQFGGEAHWGSLAPRFIRVDKAVAELEKIARRSDREGRPRRVFIASMADVFEQRDDLIEPRTKLWDALHRLAGRITPLILTKRPDYMYAWSLVQGWPDGAWAGTTVEDQQRANERIPHLLRVPAAVRFLSCEPLLGEVDVSHWLNIPAYMALREGDGPPGLDWVIAGGESGPKARPSHPGWLRSLRAQCEAAGVPFFFKQWGEWAPINRGPGDDIGTIEYGRQWKRAGFFTYNDHWHEAGANPYRQSLGHVGKHAAGRLLDGREWSEVPA